MIGDEPNPPYGEVNCLRYEYERSRTDPDPHPNMAANQVAGPLFAQFQGGVIWTSWRGSF